VQNRLTAFLAWILALGWEYFHPGYSARPTPPYLAENCSARPLTPEMLTSGRDKICQKNTKK